MRGGIPYFFGGLVAVTLLMLFGLSIFQMIQEVLAHCSQLTDDCQPADTPLVGDGYIYVVTTVGGLVSALVIAVLSVTRPGGAPELAGFSPTGIWMRRLTNGVTSLYLVLWLIAGLSALVYGVMLYPGVLPTLSDIGTTWLGLAVSATYAYFGLNPTNTAKTASAAPDAPKSSAERTTGDLALQQKEPSTSEVANSGALTKRIKRTDPEFSQLVSSQNAQIVFKDEEGTGADRVMSTRLMEKLDKLAIAVTVEWSGVKLRVTEAWDEDGEHTGASLHYEGRAADLTVFPLDGHKLGRLGRLAIEAGFDWVFFENSSHIHVSVRA